MKDASVATQEDCEQIKLDGREVDELALAATGTRASVQGKIIHFHVFRSDAGVACQPRCPPPGYCTDSGEEFTGIEWLN